MSSILKALKKLENQATDQNLLRFRRPKNHMQNTGRERVTGRPHFKKGYVIIFASLALAIGTGLVLSRKLDEKRPELITKKEVGFEKPVRLPETQAAIPDRIQKELSSQKDIKKIEPIARAAKAAPPSSYKSRRDTAVSFNKKTSSLKEARKETVGVKRNEKPGKNSEADSFASIPVKQSNQTKIELQAIAWSIDPKSRLAVINGLILRERESIDNVIVIHIGTDEVIFKKGQQEWRQMFGF